MALSKSRSRQLANRALGKCPCGRDPKPGSKRCAKCLVICNNSTKRNHIKRKKQADLLALVLEQFLDRCDQGDYDVPFDGDDDVDD